MAFRKIILPCGCVLYQNNGGPLLFRNSVPIALCDEHHTLAVNDPKRFKREVYEKWISTHKRIQFLGEEYQVYSNIDFLLFYVYGDPHCAWAQKFRDELYTKRRVIRNRGLLKRTSKGIFINVYLQVKIVEIPDPEKPRTEYHVRLISSGHGKPGWDWDIPGD